MKTKKQRKAIKREKIRNRKLVKLYPFLYPHNVWTGKKDPDYDYTYTMLMDGGWFKLQTQLCAELRPLLVKSGFLYKYQIVQIKEKFGCYDTETEVLTKDGWKYFKDVSYEDEFATLDENDCLIYQKPTDIINYHYDGKMYYLENRGVNLCVTPNHNLYISKGSYFNGSKNNEKRTYPFEFATPDKYYLQDKRFKKGCNWIGVEPSSTFHINGYSYTNYMARNNCYRTYKQDDLELPIIPFLRFLGFYVAEGYSNIRDGQGSEIAIALNILDEVPLVTKLVQDLNFHATITKCKDSYGGLCKFGNKTLALWLKENCGHLAWNKKVPQFIKELPSKYIKEFLKYLYIGDGHKNPTSNILTTTSKQLSDDVQELLLKCGYSFREWTRSPKEKQGKNSKIQGKHTIYEINWLKLTEVEIDMSKAKKTKSYKEEWIDYSNNVYCVTIPNHILYIRRNGKGVWCGNSLRWYDNGYPAKYRDEYHSIISKYERLSEQTCIKCGKPAQMTQIGSWFKPYCEKCMERIHNNYNKYRKEPIPFKYEDYIAKGI